MKQRKRKMNRGAQWLTPGVFAVHKIAKFSDGKAQYNNNIAK